MGKKVSYAYKLTADPGAKGFVNIVKVPPGHTLLVKLVHIAFPVDTLGELDIALYYGDLKVYPDEGYITGDNMTWVDEVHLHYFSQDPIKLYYRNRNTEVSKEAYVKLEGELS